MDNQVSRLASLLEHVPNERIKNYVGPSMPAYMRSAIKFLFIQELYISKMQKQRYLAEH